MKKKIVSVLLVLCLMLSLSVSALAATVTPTTDKKSVTAGDTVNVTLTLSEKIENVLTISYKVYFDSNLYTYTSKTDGSVPMTVSTVKTDANGTYFTVSAMDTTSEGLTLEGLYCTLTFTAKDDVTEDQESSFRLVYDGCMDTSYAEVKQEAGPDVTIAVTPKPDPGYTLAMGPDQTVKAGATISIPVTVGSTAGETSFHAADMTFTYDTAKLEFVSVSDTTNYTVNTNTAGTVRVLAYGEAKELGAAFSLNFKALEKTDEAGTTVLATVAKIDKSEGAIENNAPDANIIDEDTVIKIAASYKVDLDKELFTGDDTAEAGEDYTFYPTDDKNYTYDEVTAKMGEETAEVIKNEDGSYTIKNVTGDLTVTGKRTPNSYGVTVEGTGKDDVTAGDKATYGEDFTFKLGKEADYAYTVSVKIGDAAYTPKVNEDGTYTITGKDVTGEIVITVTKTYAPAEKTTIIFTGSGAADVVGGTTQQTLTGKEFTFEITEDANYKYTVKIGSKTLTGENGKYTIAAEDVVSGTITVTVDKTYGDQNVNVQKYVKLKNETSIWLVTVEADPGEGKTFCYGDNAMFKTAKYGANGTYAYLVIASTLSEEDAAKQISIKDGAAAGTVVYDCDVNRSSLVDINDAQLVYDMYNANYDSFDAVSMFKFLCADVSDSMPNADVTLLNVSDAVAIINEINK